MKLKLLLTFTLLCNVLLLNATTNSGSKTDNPNNEIVANEITCSVSTTSFCSGSSVTVTFTASGTYVSGNVFTAQLSDASGSFASPVSIGTLTAIASGTFSGLIPNNASTGIGYRIRVIASNPSTIGTDNGVNITVNQLPNPILAGNSNICVGLTSVFVSNVTGGTWSSGNTSIATVNSITGVVTGVSSGVAIINYTVSGTGTCPNATASRTVTVSPQPNAGVISGNQNICAGSTSTFASTVAGGTWSSANTSIATINSTTGVVAGVSPGTTTISYIAIGIGGCPNVMATRTVTVNSIVTPNFFSAFSLCSGSVAPVLATTSVNGITGTWLPSTISNTTSGTYSFTPTIGQCATTATLNVTVIPKVTPTFAAVPPICSGATIAPLPTTSNDGITGFWSPALNNIATTMYTFTPDVGQCSTTTSLTVTVNQLPTATISGGSSVCSGTSGIINITGTPNATVTYNENYGSNQTIVLDATGLATILTQPLFANSVYSLVSIKSAGFPSCSSQIIGSASIVVNPLPEITIIPDVYDIYIDNTTVVQPLLLESQLSGNYMFQWYENGIAIVGATNPTYIIDTVSPNASKRNFTFDVFIGLCVAKSPIFVVNQIPVPAPSGDRFQSFTQGQTLADIVVIGSNIQWYADATANRMASSPLPLNKLLVNGTTYYASQTINGFESPTRLPVTVQVALSNHSFAFKDLQVSPNPIIDVLNIKSKEIVKKVTVYNTLGQEVSHKEGNGLEFKLDFSNLVSGNYFVKVASENKQQVLKVVKK